MKKLLIIFGVFMAGSPFVSCKKMKDDIKDLKNQVSDLQHQNDTLKNNNSLLQQKLNGVINALGSDEPIGATTTFQDNDGATRTITGVYRFKSSDYSTQRYTKNNDNTYDVYIERFGEIDWVSGAWVTFTYNPDTKAATNISGGQYWNDGDSYYDNAMYTNSYAGATISVTVDSLNVTTGDISLKFSASATATYTSGAPYYYSPNQGKPVSTNFSFAGKLKLFDTN